MSLHDEKYPGQPSGNAESTPSRYPANFRDRPQHQHPDVPGWGADLDHKDRPAHPMERTPPRLEGLHWDEPEQQAVHAKIFHSTERPGLTPIFGTGQPPKGLSGAVRSVAYKYSENDLRRWFLLLFADRVNVVEGVGEDLVHGHVPNVFSEMGGRAAWRHKPTAVVRHVAVAVAVAGLSAYLLGRHMRR